MNPSSPSNSIALLLLCFATLAAADIAINCGSSGNPALINGRKWLGDGLLGPSSIVQLNGSSTTSTTNGRKLTSADEVPYTTARISRFGFYYTFQLNPGQKIIRLHFRSASYKGFDGIKDFFTVEAGAFTLLSNFSASLTAEYLGVNSFVKEFCLYLQEDEQLNIVFSPTLSLKAYAFINGIEIISPHPDLSYYHGGDTARVHLVGKKFQVHVDYGTALERMHRLIAKQTFVQSNEEDFDDMLPIRSSSTQLKNSTWIIPVDIGFSYLIRLHLSELGLKITHSGEEVFKIFIDEEAVDNTAVTTKDNAWYVDCIARMRGRKQEIKHDLLLSIQPRQELIDGHALLAAVEILKLSNNENSLAGPNPLPPAQVPLRQTIISSILVHGDGRVVVGLVVAVIIISLVNIIMQKLVQISEARSANGRIRSSTVACLGEFSEAISAKEENKPSVRARQVCRQFSLDEIKLATGNFAESFFIGKGGFGIVYKGVIDNGKTTVAVKRLKLESRQGPHEFLTEIETLSGIKHINLVSLIGYCNEHHEMILVYDYMVRGTLADHLYKLSHDDANFSYLSWKQRLNICIGAARGLDYLHTSLGIIHRDIKASNILLDETFVAKVSDFGLAKYENTSKLRSHVSTKVKGTLWHIDPHYITTKKLRREADIYAFGVVLLETLGGRPAEDSELTEDGQIFIWWARNNIGKGNVDKIVASDLRGEISKRSLKVFVGLAERCLDGDPKKRPTMAQIVSELESMLKQLDEIHVSINERTTVSVQELKPPPIENTTFKETANANELLFTRREVEGAKKSYLARFLPWNIGAGKHGLSQKDEIFASTSLYVTSKKTGFFTRRRKVKDSIPMVAGASTSLPANLCRRLSYSEILAATCNFHANFIIGSGGYGNVYRGLLDKGATTIAVKRLKASSRQGAQEFLTEIEMLSQLRHINLVSLIGYCEEHGEMIIVYDYMARGTLSDHLHNKENSPLRWTQRLQICLHAAKGLHYLHSGFKYRIIHRDVKSSNILLDQNWVAKLSDFGTSKLGPGDSNTHISTLVVGTIGYLDPEYFIKGKLTEKSDVYSFGIVLLEVLCGRRAWSEFFKDLTSDQVTLVAWVRIHLQKGEVDQIIDPNLEGQISPNCLKKYLETAMECLQEVGRDRPTMADVEWDLAYALQLQNGDDRSLALQGKQGDSSSNEALMNDNVTQLKGKGLAYTGSSEKFYTMDTVL